MFSQTIEPKFQYHPGKTITQSNPMVQQLRYSIGIGEESMQQNHEKLIKRFKAMSSAAKGKRVPVYWFEMAEATGKRALRLVQGFQSLPIGTPSGAATCPGRAMPSRSRHSHILSSILDLYRPRKSKSIQKKKKKTKETLNYQISSDQETKIQTFVLEIAAKKQPNLPRPIPPDLSSALQ